MPQSDEGCDEHNLLHEQTESTRVGIGKKTLLFGIGISMAIVMIFRGAKMTTSSKFNQTSADTSAVLMGTDPNPRGFNAAFAKKDTTTVGIEEVGEEDEQEEVTNPEHEAASFPSKPFDGTVVEYECTTESGCIKKKHKGEHTHTPTHSPTHTRFEHTHTHTHWMGDGWMGTTRIMDR